MNGIAGGLLVAVVVPILLTEFTELAPWLAARLTTFAARRLPTSQDTERYGEEWLADIEHAPGKLTKLAVAVGHLVAAMRLRRGLSERHLGHVHVVLGAGEAPVVADEATVAALRAALSQPRPAGHWPAAAAIVGQADADRTDFACWVLDRLGGNLGEPVVVDVRTAHRADQSPTVLLTALGVPARELPARHLARRAMCRDLTAERRLSIVLDGADDDDILFNMLSCLSAPSTVLITRRTPALGLVSSYVEVDELTEWESVRLLSTYIGPYRTTREPTAAADLAQRCGYREANLRLVAEFLRDNPRKKIRQLIKDLDRQNKADAT